MQFTTLFEHLVNYMSQKHRKLHEFGGTKKHWGSNLGPPASEGRSSPTELYMQLPFGPIPETLYGDTHFHREQKHDSKYIVVLRFLSFY